MRLTTTTLATAAAALTFAGTAGAQIMDAGPVVASDDAVLDSQNPDTNFNTNRSGNSGDAPNCLSNGSRFALLLGFDDLGVPAGAVAEGDGELQIRIYFNADTSTVTVSEIANDFDEGAVTFNSYLGAGATLDSDSFGTVVNSFTGAPVADDPRPGQSNNPGTSLTIPEASLQRLLDGEIAGYAINGDNFCVDLKEAFGTGPTATSPFYDPALQFSFSVIPEPTSAALLGIGGLGLLARRRR